MNTIKENLGNLILGLCELIVGILLLVEPIQYTSGIIIVAGIVLIILGVISAISHFRIPPQDAIHDREFSIGLIEIAVGLFCAFQSNWFIDTFPVLTLIYSIPLLVIGFVKVQWAIDLLRLKKNHWFLALINAALCFLAVILIMMNPLASTMFLWVYTAITLIAASVLDIITVFYYGQKVPAADIDEDEDDEDMDSAEE